MVDVALRNVSRNEAQRQAYINRMFANSDRAHDYAVGRRESDEYWQPVVANERAKADAERAAREKAEARIAELEAQLAAKS